MGLSLEVGILADLKDLDEEGFEWHANAFIRLNSFLTSVGLPTHEEPEVCEVWSGDMLGYSGLHDIRRIAAYLDSGQALPPPSTGDSAADLCLQAYYNSVNGKRPSMLTRLFGTSPKFSRKFDHLVLHSDAEGYYLPIDLSEVLYPPERLRIPGSIVGSAPKMLAELDRLAQLLQIPDSVTANSDELCELLESPLPAGAVWQQYGRESFGCVTLREGCRMSIASGAALVFT